MSDRRISPYRAENKLTNPIEMIARAELARSARAAEPQSVDTQPDMVPSSGLNRPKGLAAVIDEALGSVELPTLHDLRAALSTAAERFDADSETSNLPELDRVVVAVLEEEQLKISAYLDVRDL